MKLNLTLDFEKQTGHCEVSIGDLKIINDYDAYWFTRPFSKNIFDKFKFILGSVNQMILDLKNAFENGAIPNPPPNAPDTSSEDPHKP